MSDILNTTFLFDSWELLYEKLATLTSIESFFKEYSTWAVNSLCQSSKPLHNTFFNISDKSYVFFDKLLDGQ